MNLTDPLLSSFRILPAQERALKRLGIETVEDLLYHFPRHYGDAAEVTQIDQLVPGETAVIFGTLSGLKTKKAWKRKIPMTEGTIRDDTGSIKIRWFHQAYLAKMLGEGTYVRVEGKVSERNGALSLSNPKVEPAPNLFAQNTPHSLYPVYPESKGVTSNWFYHALKKIFVSKGTLDTLEDPIPEELLKRYHLPDLKKALIYIHAPKERAHAEAARKRFAFEEIFFIQLEKQRTKHELRNENAFHIDCPSSDVSKFTGRFPFAMTGAQNRAVGAILEDFKKGHPMSRLLEGDVGSGKTAVAAAAVYATVKSKFQTAYMAPTEILARQHFESFIKYFRHMSVQIALITGSGCYKFPSKVNPEGTTPISRSQLLKWVGNGEIAVVVGTHALIQKSVKFKNLALAIVDEQHRFGIRQRQALVSRHEKVPHLLSMTATPIPRTLALTLYGDLDLTLLDEMPAGRKKIITNVIAPAMRANAYEEIKQELRDGRQLFVICPRIDEPDPSKELAVQAKSVKQEAARLKKDIFPEYEIGILHSKMKPTDKDRIMQEFKDGKIDILVSTSVVEVGVNIENASLIVIEGAERFGLAQLHQLRGRVLRGTHQPYCFIFTESGSGVALARLDALRRAKDGFELAEFDLVSRGAGALAGTKQWGISDLAMEAVKNLKMVEAARTEAQKIIEADPQLAQHSILKNRLSTKEQRIHFE